MQELYVCITDKNAKIGKNVVIANTDVVEEGDMPEEGFCIRSVIAVVVKTPPLEMDLGEVTFFSSNHSLGIIHTAMCLEPALIIVPTINLGNGEPRISF
ncbi:hypothetical protein YC2023_096423 [Brassica napus]